MEPKTTATKALTAAVGGIGMSAVATPVLPEGTPWWAYLIVWAIPQILAGLVYIIPNKPA